VISGKEKIRLNDQSPQAQISAVRDVCALGKVAVFENSVGFYLPEGQEKVTIQGVQFKAGLWIGDQTEAEVNGVMGNIVVRDSAQANVNGVTGSVTAYHLAQVEVGDDCKRVYLGNKFQGVVVYDGQVYTSQNPAGLKEEFQLIENGQLQDIPPTINQVPLEKEPVSAGGSLESGNAYKLEKDGQQTMIISMGKDKWRVFEKGEEPREIDDVGLVDFGLRVAVKIHEEKVLTAEEVKASEAIEKFNRVFEDQKVVAGLGEYGSVVIRGEKLDARDNDSEKQDGKTAALQAILDLYQEDGNGNIIKNVAVEAKIFAGNIRISGGRFEGVFAYGNTIISGGEFRWMGAHNNTIISGGKFNKEVSASDNTIISGGKFKEMHIYGNTIISGGECAKVWFIAAGYPCNAVFIHEGRLYTPRNPKDINAAIWKDGAINRELIGENGPVLKLEVELQKITEETELTLEPGKAMFIQDTPGKPVILVIPTGDEWDLRIINKNGQKRQVLSKEEMQTKLQELGLTVKIGEEVEAAAETTELTKAINNFNQAFLSESGEPRAKLENGQVVISGKEKIILDDQSSPAQISALKAVFALGKVAVFENSVSFYLPEGQEKVTIQGVQFKANLWIGEKTEAEVSGVAGRIVVQNSAQANVSEVTGSVTVFHSAQVEVGEGCEEVEYVKLGKGVNNKLPFQGAVVYDGLVYTSVDPDGLKEEFQLIEDGQLQDIPPTINQVPLEKEPVSAGGSLEPGKAYKIERDGKQTMIISTGDDSWRVLERGKDAREIDDAGLVEFGLSVKVGEAAEPAEPTGLDPAREAEATRLAEEINTIVESFQEQFSDFHVQINGNEIRVGNLWVDGQDKPVQQSALQGLMDLQGTKSGLETVNVRFDELFVKGTAEDTKLNIRGQEFKRIAVFDQAQVGEMKVGKVAENISVSGSAIVGISEKNEAEVRIGGAGMVVAENQAYIAREGYAHGYVVIIKKGGGVITNEELQVEADKGNRVDRYEIAAKEEKVDPKNSKVFKVEQKNKTIWIIPAQETGKWEVRESGEEPRELKDNDWIEFGLTVIIKAEKRTLPKVNSW
ncbi:MAG: hypothetical protein U0946_03435, partial [Patescibacteria group bacterium]|nr:hypothetical protein [Patescibacteria group bacterium]